MQFGFRIILAPDGHLHVVRPYAQHFSRMTTPGGPYVRLGRAEYVLDRRTGRMLWGA